MSRAANLSDSAIVHVTVSTQSEHLLTEIARKGIWGRSAAEVAGRLIDQALEKFIEVPKLAIPGPKKARAR
jgi:hypothetical protein